MRCPSCVPSKSDTRSEGGLPVALLGTLVTPSRSRTTASYSRFKRRGIWDVAQMPGVQTIRSPGVRLPPARPRRTGAQRSPRHRGEARFTGCYLASVTSEKVDDVEKCCNTKCTLVAARSAYRDNPRPASR